MSAHSYGIDDLCIAVKVNLHGCRKLSPIRAVRGGGMEMESHPVEIIGVHHPRLSAASARASFAIRVCRTGLPETRKARNLRQGGSRRGTDSGHEARDLLLEAGWASF